MSTLTLLSAAGLFALGACAQIERPDTGLAGFTACSEDTTLSDLTAINPGTGTAGLAVVCAPAGAAATGGHVEIWRLTGGGFTRIQRLDPGEAPGAVDAGDLDGDGDLDLAVITPRPDGRRVAVFVNRGAEGFAPDPVIHSMGGAGIDHVAFHDWNEDGRMDLILSGSGLETHALAATDQGPDATPRFSEATILPGESGLRFSSGQLTGDASDDLVINLSRRGRMHLYEGGSDTVSRVVFYKDVRLIESVVGGGDLNGDGKPDFVARFWTDAAWNEEEPIPARVLLSQAGSEDYTLGAFLDGAHEATHAFVGEFAGAAGIAVFTQDSLDAEQPHALLYAPDDDGWTHTGRLDLDGAPQAAQAADLDGDGVDALITGYSGGAVRVQTVGG